jgi:exosome complex RNA-binding protein Rrp4
LIGIILSNKILRLKNIDNSYILTDEMISIELLMSNGGLVWAKENDKMEVDFDLCEGTIYACWLNERGE